MKKNIFLSLAGSMLVLFGCAPKADNAVVTSEVNHTDWSRSAVIYEVNTRQYTPEGTFKAFGEHLPRLQELGVDILWFMPIHPISELNRKGELGSYYAVADYKGVNPEFGTIEDFKAVVDAAHAQGMKVIIDWVPNHTGCDNHWVAEHPEYFQLNEEGQMFGPYDWTDVYQLDYSNAGMRKAMIDALSYWLTEADIDGFRCDVAGRVPVDFWNEARPALEDAAGHPIFMLAEAVEPELLEKGFDADYNWPMKDLFSEIAATAGQYTFTNSDGNIRTFATKYASNIDSLLADQAKTYPVDGFMMNMTSNHDLNSWEGTEFERLGNLAPAFAVLSYTLPGMPLIYTGQEVGLNRALEFFVKDQAPEWDSNAHFFEFYKKLNALKHARRELDAGTAGGEYTFVPAGSDNVIAYTRTLSGKGTFTLANLSDEEVAINIEAAEKYLANAVDVMSGDVVAQLPTTLEAGEYLVFTYDYAE